VRTLACEQGCSGSPSGWEQFAGSAKSKASPISGNNMKRKINRTSNVVDQIRQHSVKEPEEERESESHILSGSTLLNLALSDKARGGFLAGKIVNIIGDSSSGKTFLCLTMLAEMAHDPAFDEYLLVYDDAEASNEFDLVKLFGQRTADRILPPNLNVDAPELSHTMLDFQSHTRHLLQLEDGKPFIYILDSFDAICTEQEIKHADESEKAHRVGKEVKGTYGMTKAAQASVLLRLIAAEVKKTESLIVIISQTRDNIDPMSFQRKTRAGGKALYFYCSYEMWLAVSKKLSTKVNDRNHIQGVVSRIKITKNKTNGKVRQVDLPIYYDLGVDDIGSCIEFLISEKHWAKSGSGTVTVPEFRFKGTVKKLIRLVEEKELEEPLQRITEKVWLKIEEQVKLNRKPRYSS